MICVVGFTSCRPGEGDNPPVLDGVVENVEGEVGFGGGAVPEDPDRHATEDHDCDLDRQPNAAGNANASPGARLRIRVRVGQRPERASGRHQQPGQ